MNRTLSLAVLLLALAGHAGAAADEAVERLAIVQAVQNLFDAMATGDGELAAATLIPEGRLIVVTDGDDGVAHRAWDHADFVAMVAKGDSVLVERMGSVVSVDGPMATFRAHDFYRDGDYSHCGVDLFTLVKVEAGWQVSAAPSRAKSASANNPCRRSDRLHAARPHRTAPRRARRRVRRHLPIPDVPREPEQSHSGRGAPLRRRAAKDCACSPTAATAP